MKSVTVRLSGRARETLRQLAATTGQSMQEVLQSAIDHLWTEQFWKDTNAAFAALRNNPQGWAEELKERSLWENTLLDGIEPEKTTFKHPTKKLRRKKIG